MAFLGLQGQAGQGLLLAGGVCGQILAKGTGNKTEVSIISDHPSQEWPNGARKKSRGGELSDEGKGATFGGRYIEEIRILPQREIKPERLEALFNPAVVE